jgi:hypothetical protein
MELAIKINTIWLDGQLFANQSAKGVWGLKTLNCSIFVYYVNGGGN